MTETTTRSRRRKQRAQGAELDASWIVGPDVADSSEARMQTATGPSPSSGIEPSQPATDEHHALSIGQQEPRVFQLLQPDDLESLPSPPPSQTSSRLRPSNVDDHLSDDSYPSKKAHEALPTPERLHTQTKARKKRYASQHHAHWVEEARSLPPQQPVVQPGQDIPGMYQGSQIRQPPIEGLQAHQSVSPSIFQLQHSPHSADGGYDASPIAPLVKGNYTPQ